MKEAFDKGNYEQLKELAKSSKDKEAQFYLGVMAENGLAGKVDLEGAEAFYAKAFEDGNYQAGIGLARVYQKEYNVIDAKKIYKQIIKSPDLISQKYAKYRLARLDEKELLGNSKFNQKEADHIIAEYSDFLKNSEIAVDSPVRFKVLYHQALIEVRSAEEKLFNLESKAEAENAKKIEKYKERLFEAALSEDTPLAKKYKEMQREYSELMEHRKTNGDYYEGNLEQRIATLDTLLPIIKNSILKKFSKEIEKEEDRLRDALDLQEESGLKDAKESLEVISLRYAPAAAELINIDARMLLRDKNYKKAADKVNRVLKEDKGNFNALLIKLEANYAQVLDGDEKQYTQLFQSAREILKMDANNKKAFKIKDELKEKLIQCVLTGIVEDLKDKTKNMDGYVVGTSKKIREGYIDKVVVEIEKAIRKSEFLDKYASFDEVPEIVAILSRKILVGKGKENIENDIIKNPTKIKKEVATYISDQIKDWDNGRVQYRKAGLSDKEVDLFDNRLRFKKELKKQLSDYYKRCYILTEPGMDVAVLESDLSGVFGLVGESTIVAFAAARNVQGMAAGAAIQAGTALYEQARKDLMVQAAGNFCEIVERDDIKADQAFDRIADRIVERYGMQIDNIAGEDSIKKLAEVAAERMLCNFREVSVAGNFAKNILNTIVNPIDAIKDAVKYYAGIQREGGPKEEDLFQGIETGKSKEFSASNDIEINVKELRGGKWKANEVFECPAITSNGKDFYARIRNTGWWPFKRSAIVADSNKYGAMYIPEEEIGVGGDYKKISVSGNDKEIIAKELDQHLVLVNTPAWVSSNKKAENERARLQKSKESDLEAKGFAETRKKEGFLKAVAGVFVIGAAKILATAVFVGTLASGVGIPIAVAVGFIGFAGLISGAVDYGAASKSLSDIEKRDAQRDSNKINSQDQNKLEEKQKERERAYKKIKDTDIFIGNLDSNKKKSKGFVERFFSSGAQTKEKKNQIKPVIKEKWEDIASKAKKNIENKNTGNFAENEQNKLRDRREKLVAS